MSLKQTLDFVNEANRFKSHISFSSGGYVLNCKGVLGMVSFFSQSRTFEEIQLIIDGADAEEANKVLESILFTCSAPSLRT
ncbi:HPr family phosphocarrier protein [Paenibacillus hamazuiensis]|uniref:HPr family phosphocarrier protein n=1 Tax=Paenibacillus hamazuiensis TaxID=2936508 RepID=UPI003B849463